MLCVQPEQRLLWSILARRARPVLRLGVRDSDRRRRYAVVISVLNACTGTAVAMSGLAIDNVALIVAGALVGSAGVTLSILMAQAMNRPLFSVLAGGFGGGADAAAAGDGPEGTMKETTPDDLAVQLVYAQKVIFVPGFGRLRLRPSAELRRPRRTAQGPRRGSLLRHPPGRRPYAWPHERAAGRGQRALRGARGSR